MVALLSQVVTPGTGPYGEVLRKNGLSPLKYHKIISIICHTRFWKANRMRTMYVQKLMYTTIT
jgi:hypothetical protein